MHNVLGREEASFLSTHTNCVVVLFMLSIPNKMNACVHSSVSLCVCDMFAAVLLPPVCGYVDRWRSRQRVYERSVCDSHLFVCDSSNTYFLTISVEILIKNKFDEEIKANRSLTYHLFFNSAQSPASHTTTKHSLPNQDDPLCQPLFQQP